MHEKIYDEVICHLDAGFKEYDCTDNEKLLYTAIRGLAEIISEQQKNIDELYIEVYGEYRLQKESNHA